MGRRLAFSSCGFRLGRRGWVDLLIILRDEAFFHLEELVLFLEVFLYAQFVFKVKLFGKVLLAFLFKFFFFDLEFEFFAELFLSALFLVLKFEVLIKSLV